MKLRAMEKRLRNLQAQLPAPKPILKHISDEDMAKFEEHLFAAYDRQRRIGKARSLPSWIRRELDQHDGPMRSLSHGEIRRICKSPSGATKSAVRALKELQDFALALSPMRQARSRSPRVSVRKQKSLCGGPACG